MAWYNQLVCYHCLEHLMHNSARQKYLHTEVIHYIFILRDVSICLISCVEHHLIERPELKKDIPITWPWPSVGRFNSWSDYFKTKGSVNIRLWDLCETCMRIVWDLHETCVRLAWYLCETWVRLVWDLCETCVRLGWDLCETWVRLGWDLCETFIV